jgi:glucosamine-6-phosphate deaminase
MKITVIDAVRDTDVYVAWQIIRQILNKPDSLIGLSTGQTTTGIHSAVAEIYKNYKFPTSDVKVFGVDEIIMVPDSEITCSQKILNQFVKPLNIPESNLIMPAYVSDDFDKEVSLFESRLFNTGCIDLQILGIGEDGHLGMNLPHTTFESNTRLVSISGPLKENIEKLVELPKDHNLMGITLGIRTIMNAKKIILVAKGKKKSEIINRSLFGPITTIVPASVLQLHPDCEVVLDAEAACEFEKAAI